MFLNLQINADSIMHYYSIAWTIIESLAFIFVFAIFFMDPIRRWNFFGYRPTAVMGIFDPELQKVLFSKVNGAWSFNQGGMYANNIYHTATEILKRELGIPENRFKLSYTKKLGKIRIKNKQLLTRARISTISMFPHLRGKGYMACIIRMNLKDIEKEIVKGTGIQEIKILSVEEAKEHAKMYITNEHQPEKRDMILSMLDEIDKYSKDIKEWEEKNLKKLKEEKKDNKDSQK